MPEASTETLGEASLLAPSKDVVWRDVAGEMVLLDTVGNVLMGLNGTGARMWTLLDGERSLGEIAALVAIEYEQEPGAVLLDLVEFARALLGRGLLCSA